MSRSDIFVASTASVDRKINKMFDTDTTTGEIIEFARITEITTNPDGSASYGAPIDRTPDLTAAYTVAGTAAEEPILVQLPTEALAIDGASHDTTNGEALAAIPAHADYAEIFIEDENIRWTQDGSAPADNNGEQEMAGTTIRLYGRPAIDGFRALVIDNVGDIATAGVSNLSVSYFNMNPERTPLGV